MDISGFFDVVKIVLSDKRVIATAVVVFLCMDFGVFVANYTKKPPKPKRRRAAAKPVPAAPVSGGGDGGSESSSGGNAESKAGGSSAKRGAGPVSAK